MILMDLKMPEMDGYESNKKIKSIEELKNIPVIALTALAMKSDEEKIMNEGFAGYLRKPIQKKDLFNELMKHLNHTVIESDFRKDGMNGLIKAEITQELLDKLPEILITMKSSYLSEAESLKDTLLIGEIKEFAKNLIDFGTLNNFYLIINYSENLLEYCEQLELDKIIESLNDFMVLIKEIEELSTFNK
jgi:CheY-like chemotaxis protein